MFKRIAVATVASLVFAVQAFAQDLDAIKPFLSDKTIVVVDVDLAKFDLKAFEAKAIKAMEDAKVGEAQMKQAREEMTANMARGQKWLDALKDAKAQRAFVVVSMPQAGPGGPPMFTVVPTADDAAATAVGKTIDEAMASGEGEGGPPPTATHERIGNAVVIGEAPTLAALKTIKPVDRADLATAHATATKAGDGAIRVAFAPTGPMRGMLMMAADPVVANVVNAGVQHAGLSVGLPPNESLNLTIQSKDAKSAEALAKLINGFMQDLPPGAPPEMAMLQPNAAGDTVKLSLDQAAMTKLIDGVLPSMIRARNTAFAVKSASNIRTLLMMTIMYAQTRDGQYPDTLADLREGQQMPQQAFDELMTNPAQPTMKPGYIYIKPKDAAAAPGGLVIHEAFEGPFPTDGVNVGFGDGSVRKIGDEAQFNELLKAAK
ncbi:MAG TPA: H-X9-DG-CTERM domain-containing protein [Tepidisphaeraceae bacterium]|jgi:hypothetical protein|nr:H-X9-DG-CTERM domain-containing protein [Tepidisphaeraceae bacterium]